MLAAVHLDNEAVFNRHEVGDVRADRPLPTKFVPGQAPTAQH
jgi:hypothetical protein